jgi:hypothetical protein
VVALFLGMASLVYEQVGPAVAGDNFTLILWVIRGVTVAVIVFIGWRLYVGLRDGYLLFDDLDD